MKHKATYALIALAIPVLALTFLAFLVFRLVGVIGWSYWWIFAPLWGPIALYALFLAAVVIYAVIVTSINTIRYK